MKCEFCQNDKAVEYKIEEGGVFNGLIVRFNICNTCLKRLRLYLKGNVEKLIWRKK